MIINLRLCQRLKFRKSQSLAAEMLHHSLVDEIPLTTTNLKDLKIPNGEMVKTDTRSSLLYNEYIIYNL